MSVDSGDGTAPSMVDVSGKTVTLTLASAVTDRQTVTVTYAVPTTGTDPKPIRDGAENPAEALTDQKVTNDSDDTTGPEFMSASVAAAGTSLTIVFDETLDAEEANLPAAARFAVTAGDGARFEVAGVGVAGANVTLTLASGTAVVRAGQTVTLAYTDPNADDDDPRGVVQDDSGNDAADFTTGESGVGAVVNNSTEAVTEPDAPTGLVAEGAGSDRIVLRWDAPADTGGQVITGYRVEVSTDGNDSWTELASYHNTMNDGRFEYIHTGLSLGEVRHYRVSARNGSLESDVGPASDVVEATTVHPGAPDAPTELTATAGLPSPRDGTTLIVLAWAKPANEGDSAITGYRIDYSEDVDPLVWQPLVADTGNRNRSHRDIELASETTRHYRVFAKNDDGTGLPSNVVHTTTDDIESPELVSASVPAEGTSLTIVFDEALDAAEANLPAAARFAVSAADGARFMIDSITVSGTDVTLTLASGTSFVRMEQAVTVVYTDRTANNDPRGVVQDDSGNDAAAFTLGPDESVTVANGSTRALGAPGAPRNLETESGGDDRIVLTWDAPADTGGRVITGYRVEVSTDGNDPWNELAASHDTMRGGRFEYIHTDLSTGDQRHYRVSARNASGPSGLGLASDVVMGVVDLKGRVVLSAAPASVPEGGAATWTVTATTDEDAPPESGLQMQVQVVSEDGTAAAPGDYAAVDAAAGTVTFRRSDFAREDVPDVGYRYVAVKTGTVAIADDVEVEPEENFTLGMSIGSGGTGWVPAAERVEVAIPDTDEWGVVVVAEPAEIVEGETRAVALTARIVLGDGSAPAEEACVVRFPVTVRLETGGTATAGTDYTLDGALAGRTIAACGAETSWRVTLAAAVDTVDDAGETVAFAPQLAGAPAAAPLTLAAAAVTVREGRGVVLGRFALEVKEGGSASYTAVLTSRPTGTVRLTPAASGSPDVTVSPARLTFTPHNWNLPQTLLVRATDDADDADDAAQVSHLVAGADYDGVTAADVPVAVLDDDKSFGVMTVRLSDGADGAGTHDPAPVMHHGEPFHITLWWSERRTHHYDSPRLAIGPDRAIRVTGAAVTPVKDEYTGKWTQSRLRLRFTPDGTGDVTLMLEPMDCSYPDWMRPRPDPHALCAWRAGSQGITGLAERVRWTVRRIGDVPAAPRNLTLGTDEILTVQPDVVDSRTVLTASFDADPDAARWRVEAQAAGGDWSGARVWRGATQGSRHVVRLDSLAVDGAWEVRARLENRYGEGPWAEARTSDGAAPPAPRGLAVAQGADGRSVTLTWTPSAPMARYQYRLGRLAQTMAGGWRDIPDSGPGAANRRSFTVHGLERTWEIKAQLRAVDRSGRAGAASAEARLPAAAPEVLAGRIAVTSDPGEDGRYTVGDRIEVAVTMSRPVRHEGAVPTVRLVIGTQNRDAALVRIRQPNTFGIRSPGYGSGDTLFFAYVVQENDEDTDGIGIPAGGLRLNGGRLLDASPGGGLAATFRLGQALRFAAHRVQAVLPRVERIEWLGNQIWVHYARDLDPLSRIDNLQARQYFPGFSMSTPVSSDVIDARIVRGRGWSRPCKPAEAGCRVVRLTLGGLRRAVPGQGTPLNGYGAPYPDETVELSYTPHPHLPRYRLRDAVGNEAAGFRGMEAQRLGPGADPVLWVEDGRGWERVYETVRFTVRLAPAATSEVTVDYATADGTAKAPEDYTTVSNRLVFAPGETVKTIAVPIVDDTVKDSGETFSLFLANPSGARLADGEATGTIWNDELLTASFESLPASHDGETAFTFGLAFREAVAVSAQALRDAAFSVTGGAVTGARQAGGESGRNWEITVEPSGNGDVTIALAPKASCDAVGAICTEDGLGLERAIEATVAYALGTLRVSGVPQVGNTLEAGFGHAPGGTLAWQWLRGSEPIAGAQSPAYTPTGADVGARLSVRVERGGATVASAPTGPVWPAPANPPLAAGEEELLSAVLTLGSYKSGVRLGGYGRKQGQLFGAMDNTSFEDGGTTYAIEQFVVLADGSFTLATDSRLPGTAGLAAYWNGYRITGLERTGGGGLLVGRTPQPESEYSRYMDGSSDGIRVAVSLRRTRAAVGVTGASLTSGPGGNGTWDTDEHVEAEVRFSGPVTVTGPREAKPTLGITLDGRQREAAYIGGSGTDTLSFRYTVATQDDGAKRARIVANGLRLNGAAIEDGEGREAELGFSVAPWVTAVALVPDASGDRSWTGGETIEVRLTFSEAVTVADGNPWLDVRIGGSPNPGALGYASGSGSATLVFSTEVPEGARALAGVAVVADSLVPNGAAIVSEASGLAAELGHDGTEPTAAPGPRGSNPLTAEFRDLPDAHGAAAFTFELRFSEEIPLGYSALRGAALQVTNGAVSAVRRATAGENRAWDVTVTPEGGGNVTVTLPARADCAAAGAICTADDRPLSAPVSATVPETAPAGAPFRVRLVDVPREHAGSGEIAFRVEFTKEPRADYSYATLRNSTLKIRRGAATRLTPKVRRLNAPHNDRWAVTVEPGSKEDLTVSVGPFSACTDAGAVCTDADEVLANKVEKTIVGPPGLSVADARVYEAPGATVDFTVTLGRASRHTVQVDYATGDGTATAGEDYEPTSGTLAFAPGETAKTVSVPVFEDGHDEDEETFTLTLSNPRGGNAWLKDATATGTIENTDAMPRAWLARFGRTVAEQVLDAVEGRFSAQRTPGVAVSLAGQALGGASAEAIERLEEREAEKRLETLSAWLRGETDVADAGTSQSRALTGRDILTGSAFTLTGGTAEGGFGSVWGRGAISRFNGREGELTLSGEAASAMLGADWTRDRGTVGMMVMHSRGEGGYTGEGEVSSTLTGLYPYGRYEVNERLAVWGVTGYGAGTLTLTPAGQGPLEADMDLVMGAVGVRGVAVEAPAEGGVELSVTSDAMAVRTSSEAVSGSGGNLAEADADVTRLRLGLKGTWRGIGTGGGATFVPSVEIGLRHDGGDAETGFGLDVGGALAWSDPRSGLSAEVRGRGLLTHEAGGFRDRGIAGSLRWDPRPDSERGFALTLTQTMGASASGGMDALLGRGTLEGLAANGDGKELENRRLELKIGYGFGVFGDRFTATPEAGLGLSNSHREYSLGWRLGLARSGPSSLELRLDGTRRKSGNNKPEHGIALRLTVRW